MKLKVLIAVPTVGQIPTKTVMSLIMLMFQKTEAVEYLLRFTENSLVYDARNEMAKIAVEGNADYVLWIDSDMTFPADALQRMLADDKDVVTGLYFTRHGDHKPVIYHHVGEDGTIPVKHVPNELFEVEGCGFGMVLMKTSVLRKVAEAYHLLFHPIPSLGEDLSFCYRWKQLGGKIWCDPSIKCGHIGECVFTEADYKVAESPQNDGLPLNDMKLSVRSFNALYRAGIKTIGQLKRFKTTSELQTVYNLGIRSAREIAEKAKNFGIWIGEE